MKNFNIKQRFVNEAKPFSCYNSQNLFKLPSEKGQRTRLLDGDPALAKTYDSDKDTNPLNNAAIKLLEESDPEEPECVVHTEKAIVEEFEEWVEENKSETSS